MANKFPLRIFIKDGEKIDTDSNTMSAWRD